MKDISYIITYQTRYSIGPTKLQSKQGHIKIGCYVSIIIQLKEERDEYEEVVQQQKAALQQKVRILN